MCRPIPSHQPLPLIGLAGQAGTGKDTVGNHLRMMHGFSTLALADPIRAGLRAMLGLNHEDLMRRDLKEKPIEWLGRSPRELAQTLGTEWGRELVSPEIWLRVAQRSIEILNAPSPFRPHGIVVTDIRFENEAEWLRGLGGTVWHIRREQAGLAGATSKHVSEQSIPIIEGDVIVENNGTLEALFERVSEIMNGDSYVRHAENTRTT